MRRSLLVFLTLTMSAGAVIADDLPKLGWMRDRHILAEFPLGKATLEDVYAQWGAPQERMKDLPFNGEVWTYRDPSGGTGGGYTYFNGVALPNNAKTISIEFRDGIAYDVMIRYPTALAKPRSARKTQGIDKK